VERKGQSDGTLLILRFFLSFSSPDGRPAIDWRTQRDREGKMKDGTAFFRSVPSPPPLDRTCCRADNWQNATGNGLFLLSPPFSFLPTHHLTPRAGPDGSATGLPPPPFRRVRSDTQTVAGPQSVRNRTLSSLFLFFFFFLSPPSARRVEAQVGNSACRNLCFLFPPFPS